MNWIKVTEKLPDFDTPVLVYGEDKVTIAQLESATERTSGVTLNWVDADSVYEELYITPTHWAEITKPEKL